MGFFDRFSAKKTSNPAPAPASPAAAPQAPAPTAKPAPAPVPAPAATPGDAKSPISVVPQLTAAREKLDARDLAGAVAIYEEILTIAGDRADVLVAMSGDLGSCGYVEQIIELVAPRYDAEKHGPATGLNVLQAYLAVRNTTAAQHVLDVLFGLQRPELEERLYGFSNALAELIEAERTGKIAQPSSLPPGAKPPADDRTVALVTISKPIWAYGVDTLPGVLPAKDSRLRRVAFAQLATPGLPDIAERTKQPEDELGRFSRGFALWMAETLFFSPSYAAVAAIGTLNKQSYMLFPTEWTMENLRQLVDTSGEALDYIFTGSITQTNADYQLVLRLWEVKKFRERKTFTVSWTPATADAELAKLHEHLRLFMEWKAYPTGQGLAYAAPAKPSAWIQTLGTSLSLFLADKSVIAPAHATLSAAAIDLAAEQAVGTEAASLAWLTLKDRATRLGLVSTLPEIQLRASPLVAAAQDALP